MLSVTECTADEVGEAFLAACANKAVRGVETRARMSHVICFWHRMPPEVRIVVCQRLKSFLEPLYLKRRLAECVSGQEYDQLQDIVANWQYASNADKSMVYAAAARRKAA